MSGSASPISIKHGIDFADIQEGFFLDAMIGPAKNRHSFAVGRLDGAVIVIFAAQPASRKERRLLR
jgi:hypothetical protein